MNLNFFFKNFALFFFSICIYGDSFHFNLPNNNGVIGTINTPSARFYDAPAISFTAYRGIKDRKLTLSFYPYNWLDASLFYTSIKDEPYGDSIFTQDLKDKGLTYNCWCTRKEIRESVSAPHNGLPDGAYNGRCRWLSAKEISEYERSARSPATRIITNGEHLQFEDRQVGLFEGAIDDFVLARGDGTPSYNLTSVVDDAAMGVTEVVRGDDLLSTTPRQLFLCEQLKLKAPTYAHVPLVLNSAGKRLAKRDGAVTLSQRISMGESVVEVLNYLLSSLSLDSVSTVMELELVAKVFNPTKLPRHAWILDI